MARWVLLATVVAALAACTAADEQRTDDPDPTVSRSPVEPAREAEIVVAEDVSMPPVLAATPVAITVRNETDGPVTIAFIQVGEQSSPAEVEGALADDPDSALSTLTVAGGIGDVAPGESASATILFPEGSYLGADPARIDEIAPAAFDVEDAGGKGRPPRPAFGIQTDEYSFRIAGPPPATRALVEITNVGALSHEVVVTEGSGKSGKRVARYLAPAPRTGRLWAPVELASGSYTIACYLPEVRTGKPHAELGMRATFEIAPAI